MLNPNPAATPEWSRTGAKILFAALLVLAGVSTIRGQAGQGIDPQRTWALAVGISNYAKVEPLQYAASDAQSFAQFLASPRGGGIPADHITTLLEEQATRDAVTLSLDGMVDKVKPGDTVIVYLAGHGHVRNNLGYFLPIEGDLKSAAATGVYFQQIKDLIELGIAQARIKILITDICHAGRIGTKTTPLGEKIQNLINEQFENLTGGKGIFLNLLASRPTERSYESDELGHGVFTYALLEALNGKAAAQGNPIVEARRVVDHVLAEVPKYTGQSQHPVVNKDFEPSLPLAFIDKPGPPPVVLSASVTLEILNAGKSGYIRVQWVDPKTDAVAVRPLASDDSAVRLISLSQGELQLNFIDAAKQSKQVRVKLNPGRNVLNLLDVKTGRLYSPGRPDGQIASLRPMLPAAPPAAFGMQIAAPGNDADEAVVLMRLEKNTEVLADDVSYGSSTDAERFVQLAGLTKGTHKINLVYSPEREQRFRLKLFAGKQIFDPSTGELRYIREAPRTGSSVTPPDSLPAPLQETYRRFIQAVWEERLIQPQGNCAWDYYQQLQDRVPPALRQSLSQTLAVAMGDRAQRIILKYLAGGDIRWNAAMFEEGLALTERMSGFFKTPAVLQSQRSFFAGRALLERGDYARADQELQRAVSLDAEAGHAYNALGLSYWKQNLLDRAIPALEQAIAISPRWNYPRMTMAFIRFEQRRYQEAEQIFREAIRIDEEDGSAHHGLAQLQLLLGNMPAAESEVGRAIDYGPGNAYAHETLGKIRQVQQRYEEAERQFRLAMRLEPDEPSFALSLAELLRLLGRNPEAGQAFARLAGNNNLSPAALQAYARFLREQNRAPEAEALFGQAIRKSPKDANLHVMYGAFLRDAGRDRDAERELKTALQIAPRNAFARHDMALLYLTRKQPANAENELAQAFKDDPRLAAPHRFLGQIRVAQNRFPEALAEYRKALELSIDVNQQQELREEIARTGSELARQQVGEAGKKLSAGRNAEAWSIYCSALKLVPESRELRTAILQFAASRPPGLDPAQLPPGTLAQILKSEFWQAQLQAETEWQKQDRRSAIRTFTAAFSRITPEDRRRIASTDFNLGNEGFGIHPTIHRWAQRMIEERDYAGALGLLESSLRQGYFAVVPNYNPLTVDSLWIRPDLPDPREIKDYDIAHHPDRKAHELFAAARAGAGDLAEARKYLPALESARPDLQARLQLARVLQREKKWGDGIALLMEVLSSAELDRQQESLPDAFVLLARMQCEAGDCEAGRKTLGRAQQVLPGNKAIEAAAKQLR